MLQTWLPLPNFQDSIASLSDEHLEAQRIHVLELMEYFHSPEKSSLPEDYVPNDLTDTSPIIMMWQGYELQLIEYGLEASDEYAIRTGRNDPLYTALMAHMEWGATEEANMGKPNWFGNVDFHLGHQAELLREDGKHYSQYFVRDGDREMIWPKSDFRAAS